MMDLDTGFLQRPIAHRALHDGGKHRAENSLAAIRAAIKAGYGIEIDVQPSLDGVAMVFHDEHLKRLTGIDSPINSLSADKLGELQLLGGGGAIPTLRAVLDVISGQVPLLIEIKDQHGAMGETDGALERAVSDDLAGYAGPVAVMSFNPHSVRHMQDLAPAVARGLTTSSYDPIDWAPLDADICEHLRQIPDYDRVGACFISHEVADLGRPRVAELKERGAKILCWTVKTAAVDADARKVAHNVTFEGYLP